MGREASWVMLYDFSPFVEVVSALGSALVPLAVPAIVAWLVFSWIADLIFRN